MVTLFVMMAGVVLASALCSGTEAALLSLPVNRARQLAADGIPGSRRLLILRERPAQAIGAIVVLNNVANIVGSMMVGATAVRVFGSHAMGWVSATMTIAIILLAEILPKSIGERFAEPIGLRVAAPLTGLVWLLTPVLWVLSLFTRGFERDDVPITDEDEIRFLVASGGHEGVIEDDESEMIQRVFLLNDSTAADILTPRVAMSFLFADATLREAEPYVRTSEHSRIVVVGKNRDDALGMVLKVELLSAMMDGRWDRRVLEFLRPVRIVDLTTRADDLLRLFRSHRSLLAVVSDGFGGVAGVVTLEDVLEVLTGEIVDETDTVADLAEVARREGLRGEASEQGEEGDEDEGGED